MASVHQTPLKGIPYGKQLKPMPVHLKGMPKSDLEDAASIRARDLSLQSEDGDMRVQKGLFDWIFGPSNELPPALAEPEKFALGGKVLDGHYADDVRHSLFANSRYEIRTFMPVEGGKVASVNFAQLLEAKALPPFPSQRYVVSYDQVKDAVKSTEQEREHQLNGEVTRGARVVPKDSSLNPTDYSMYLRSTSDVSTRYAGQLSDIGRIEGFHVVAGIPDGSLKSYERALERASNVSFMEVPHGEVWTEDYSEPTLGGGQTVPAMFEDYNGSLIREAISEGRQERFAKLGLAGDFAYHGAVNHGKYQKFALARGTVTEGPLRQALSYMEGGNIYTGSRPNGDGYVLVGKDSFHVSKRLLEKQTGREWSDAEVSTIIAEDLGLKAENVVAVEQPGAFHLDMRMMAIAPGEFVVNDSHAACDQQIQWLKADVDQKLQNGKLSAREAKSRLAEIDKNAVEMRKQAERMAPYEAMTTADLEKAGFTVHRLGAAFVQPDRPTRDTSNYFNARHGTNEQGERFAILMGGQAHEEAFVAQKLVELTQGNLSRIHFLDPSVTQKTLDLWGGLKCRTKPEGELVADISLSSPVQSRLETV